MVTFGVSAVRALHQKGAHCATAAWDDTSVCTGRLPPVATAFGPLRDTNCAFLFPPDDRQIFDISFSLFFATI